MHYSVAQHYLACWEFYNVDTAMVHMADGVRVHYGSARMR